MIDDIENLVREIHAKGQPLEDWMANRLVDKILSQHARIRELEAALGEALESWGWHARRDGAPLARAEEDRIATLRRLLEGKT